MNKFGYKQLVVVGLLALLVFPATAGAFDVKLSGQVSALVMYANDGDKSDLLIGDNDNSSSRIAIGATETFNDITVGAVFEVEGQMNPSDKMAIEQHDNGDNKLLEIRKFEGYFKGGFGKVSLGQGSGAADGTTEVDLSGTSVALFSLVTATAGGLEFTTDGVPTGITVGKTRNNYDGLSRLQRVRYDSPAFAGFTASASLANGGAMELAAHYEAEFYGNFEVALGYVSNQNYNDDNFDQIGGSLSYLLPFGLNFTVAVSQRNNTYSDVDPLNYYGKIGYKFGIHAVAVEYGVTQDLNKESYVSSNIGLGYVVQPWKKVELFTAARQYTLDMDGGSDPDPILQIYAGTRIKF